MNLARSVKYIHASLVGLLAVAASAAQQPPVAPASPVPYAGWLVSEWTGRVQLQLPGASLSAPTRGESLPAGTEVDTHEGLIVLVLEDESEVLLRPQTRVVLNQPGAGNWNYLQLLLGHIRASVRKRTGGAPPFQLGRPSAVIAVRGTRFDVEVNRHNVTEVDVFSGLVEVGSVAIPGQSVLVEPGFSTRVGPGGAPEPPIRTNEIRPDAEAPDETMSAEFLRGKDTALANPGGSDEISERDERSENELENESQNSVEGGEDRDADDAPPPNHL